MCVGARTRILHRPILYTDTYTKQSAHRATERKAKTPVPPGFLCCFGDRCSKESKIAAWHGIVM